MYSQEIISHRDLALIAIAHENRFLHRAFQNILRNRRFLRVQRNVLGPDGYHRRLILFKSRRRDEREQPFFGLDLSRLSIAVEFHDLAVDQVRET